MHPRSHFSAKKPNVLWIMADQFHAGAMGFLGSQVRTPALDSLAKTGLVFEKAYCNNPICGPSRTSFITGQRPGTHGILGNTIGHLDLPVPPTIPLVFRNSGYETALIGKAHMLRKWDAAGFEHLRYSDLCDADPADPFTCHYYQYLSDQGLADLYDHGALPPSHPGHDMSGFVSDIPREHSLETWTGDESLAFLKSRNSSKPFFLKMSFQRPHDPYTIPKGEKLLYDPNRLRLPDNAADFFECGFANHHPIMSRYAREGRHGYPFRPDSPPELKTQLAYYYSLITEIDLQIGRVLNFLKEQQLEDHTAVLFTADHGDFAGEHGLMLKNLGLFEAVHRIPFLLRFPGGPKNRCISELVESVDLFPTLCELAGLQIPESVEGKSVLPLLSGEPGKSEVIAEWSFNPDRYPHYNKTIRTPTHRLSLFGKGEGGEFHDLENDPGEMKNLFGKPEAASLQYDLEHHLATATKNSTYLCDFRSDRLEDAKLRDCATHRARRKRAEPSFQ